MNVKTPKSSLKSRDEPYSGEKTNVKLIIKACQFFSSFHFLPPFISKCRQGIWAAIQLTLTCGSTACALRATSEYSFTNLRGMDSWVGCLLVISGPMTGFKPRQKDTRLETLCLNHSHTTTIGHSIFWGDRISYQEGKRGFVGIKHEKITASAKGWLTYLWCSNKILACWYNISHKIWRFNFSPTEGLLTDTIQFL